MKTKREELILERVNSINILAKSMKDLMQIRESKGSNPKLEDALKGVTDLLEKLLSTPVGENPFTYVRKIGF